MTRKNQLLEPSSLHYPRVFQCLGRIQINSLPFQLMPTWPWKFQYRCVDVVWEVFFWESMETLLQKCIVFTTCSFKLRRFCRQGSLSWSFSWWDELGRTLGVTCGNMRKANGLGSIPIGSTYDVFTYILMISMVNVKVNLPYMHHMGYDVQISCCETSLFLEKTYHGTRIVRYCQKGKWFLKNT